MHAVQANGACSLIASIAAPDNTDCSLSALHAGSSTGDILYMLVHAEKSFACYSRQRALLSSCLHAGSDKKGARFS